MGSPADPHPDQLAGRATDETLPEVDPDATWSMDDLRVVMDRRRARGEACLAAERLEGCRIGPYLVGKMLGEGGMACVYRATDCESDRLVAFKVLKPQYQADRNLRVRFEREARSMADIANDHVVHIYGFHDDQAARAIVMELMEGGSLAERIREQREAKRLMPIREAVELIIQAARGIHAAHERGIIHRDVKPSNLLLDAAGHVKVADFGAIHLLESATWLTGVGQRIGTPGYMSPEQCAGDHVTQASDVYSLGATCYELLAGKLPFEVEEASPFALMLKHISEPAPDPRIHREEIPGWVAAAVLRTLQKEPKERFQTAGDFGDALVEGLAQADDPNVAHEPMWHMDLAAIRQQLLRLPQRAIVCWACRCARRVQHVNPDTRVEQALELAESTVKDPDVADSEHGVVRALSRIRALRAASITAACADNHSASASASGQEAARAAAAAAACAAARCIDDAAADAAFAARSALAALENQNQCVKTFWKQARTDFSVLQAATAGQEGTVGLPIPTGLFDDPS